MKKYDAFISYRHRVLDKAIAEKLQILLEKYRPPKNGIYQNTTRIQRVFVDGSELPTSGDLSADIKKALEQSEFLIVVCSEETKRSIWCMDEIDYFKALHDGNNERILTILVSGDPSEVFPDSLQMETHTEIRDGETVKYTSHVEPLAANVVAASTQASLKKLKTEFLRIAAPILGCGYDDLYERHQRRKIKMGIAISLAALLTLLAIGTYIAISQMQIHEQRVANETAQTMTLLNDAQALIDEGGKTKATEIVLDVIDKNKHLPALISERAEELLTQSACVAKYSQYANIRPSGIVNSVVFSDDSTKLFVATDDGVITVYHAKTGFVEKTFNSDSPVDCLYLNGGQLYAMTKARELIVFNIANGTSQQYSFQLDEFAMAEDNKITEMMMYDGKLLFTYYVEASALIEIDMATRQGRRVFESEDEGMTDSGLRGYVFFDRRRGLVVATDFGATTYTLYDIKTGVITAHKTVYPVWGAYYVEKLGKLFTFGRGEDAGPHGNISVFSVEGEKPVFRMVDENEFDMDTMRQAWSVTDDGRFVALGNGDGDVAVIDMSFEGDAPLKFGAGIISLFTVDAGSSAGNSNNLVFWDDEVLCGPTRTWDGSAELWKYNHEGYNHISIPNTNRREECIVSDDSTMAVIYSEEIPSSIELFSLKDSLPNEEEIPMPEDGFFGTNTDEYGYESIDMERDLYEGFSYSVVAVSADGAFQLESRIMSDWYGVYNSGWVFDAVNRTLFKANIPKDFVGIAIKDDTLATLLTPSHLLCDFNPRDGKIIRSVQLPFLIPMELVEWNGVKFNVDYQTDKAFIASTCLESLNEAPSKGIAFSTKTGNILFYFSDPFGEDFLAIDRDARILYRCADPEGETVKAIKVPSWSEVLEMARAQVDGEF